MSRKLTCLLIVMLLMLVSMNIGIMEGEPLTDGDYQYSIEKDGTAKITKYIGARQDVTIPSILGGANVSILGHGCFSSSGLTKVVIPEGVKVIEESAFTFCDLKSVNIPSSVESIGWLVFVLNMNLSEFSVMESNPVYNAIDGVLYDKKTNMLHTYPTAKNDTYYAVLPGTKIIFGDAFSNALNLKSIVLPDGLTVISNRAFYGCRGIESIVLPKSVMLVGSNPFLACSNLTDIQADNAVYGSIDGVLIDKKNAELVSYPERKSPEEYTVPEGIKSIGESAFRNNTFIKSIILPQGLRSIGRTAFYNCSQLSDIHIPFGVETIGNEAIGSCVSLLNVYIPPTVKTIEQQDFPIAAKAGIMLYVYQSSPAEAFALSEKFHFTILEMTEKVDILTGLDIVTGETVHLDLASDSHMLDLDVMLTPEASYKSVLWSSSSDKFATVDRNGVVTGRAKGTATITATAADGSKIKAACKVAVSNLVQEIKIMGDSTLKAGKKITLKAEIIPASASNRKIVWISSDKEIATVSTKGEVSAKKVKEEKQVTITATAQDGSNVVGEFLLTIVP